MLNKTEVPEIKQAVVFLHEMSADEEMKERARSREKQIRDQLSAIDYEREKTLSEVAANLREMGMSEEVIQNAIKKRNT